MSMPDEFSVRVECGSAIVTPVGELDLAAASPLRVAMQRAIDVADDAVRVDLSGVTFVDSTALAIFVEARREAVRRQVAFCLSQPAPNVRRVLAVTRLDELLCEE
jgi:anti-sigma B factor antagonist